MRIKHRYVAIHKNEQLLADVRDLGIPFHWEDVDPSAPIQFCFLEFFLYEDDPRYEERKARLAQYDLNPTESTEFLPVDVESASWFMLDTGQFVYPQPEDGFKFGNRTYDISHACPLCMIGQVQIAPFRFKTPPKARHSALLGLNWVPFELFVRTQASELWLAERFTGVRFSSPVLHKTSQPLDGLLQAHVDTFLPQGISLHNLVAEPCSLPDRIPKWLEERLRTMLVCKTERYNLPTRGPLTFPADVLHGQPDFVRTFKWFGSGGESYRPILVSKRVRDSALKHRLRGGKFTPVLLT